MQREFVSSGDVVHPTGSANGGSIKVKAAVAKRWKLLRSAILGAPVNEPQNCSKTSFMTLLDASFEQSECLKIEGTDNLILRIVNIRFPLPLSLCLPERSTDASSFFSEYSGFLNTGNVRIWNSEIALALWTSKNLDLFRNKSVLEIAAGMTGLAGLTIGAAQVGASIIISDGNPDSVASIHLNIDRNLHVLNPPAVTSRQLLWGRDAVPSVDIVIGADCTFDCGMHLDLISTLFNAMSFPHGLAFLFVPSRGGSMASFILACETYSSLCFPGKGLVVDCQERYDDRVWFLHQQNSGMLTNEAKEKEYEPDKDYPFFLKLSWRV